MADSGVPYELVTPAGTVEFNDWVHLGTEPTGHENLMPSPNGVNGWRSFVVPGTGVDRPLRVLRTDPSWDAFITDPTMRTAFESNFDRIISYDDFAFTSGLSTWKVPTWLYMNVHDGLPALPLLDTDLAPLYVPWPTQFGPYVRQTADISNAAYRAAWIAAAKVLIDKGAAGIWIDDVTTDSDLAAVRNGGGAPLRDMSWWTEAMTSFVEQIRTELKAYKPTVEIVHNVVWYQNQPTRWLAPASATKLTDFGFDLSAETWVTDGDSTVTWVDTGGRTSPGALQVVKNGTGFNEGVRTPFITDAPGSVRSISAWVNVPAGNTVHAAIGEVNGTTFLRETQGDELDTTGGWQHVTATATTQADSTGWYAVIRVGSAGSLTYLVDDAATSNGAYPLEMGQSTPPANPVRRQIAAADWVNLEDGFTDVTLTAGPAETVAVDANQWSLRSLLSFIDACHELDTHVIAEQWNDNDGEREYTLATWLYACSAGDGIGLQSELVNFPNVWDKWSWRWGARTARSDNGTTLSATLMFGTAEVTPVDVTSGRVVRTHSPVATGVTNSPFTNTRDVDFQNAGVAVSPSMAGYWAMLASSQLSTSTVQDVEIGDIYGVRVKLKVLELVDSDLPFTLRAYTTGTDRDPDVAEVHEVQTPFPAKFYPAGSTIALEIKFQVEERQTQGDSVYPGEDVFPSTSLYPGEDEALDPDDDIELGMQLSVDAVTSASGELIVGEVFVNQLQSLSDPLQDYGDGATRGWRWDGTPGGSASREFHWAFPPGVLQLTGVTGLEPLIRKTTKNRPQRHGITVGRGRLGGMTPSFQGSYVHDGPATQESLRRQLYAALYSMTDAWGTLYWQPAGSDDRRSVDVTLLEKPDTSGDLFKTFQFMLVTSQPFIRGETMNSEFTSLLSDQLGGGLTFPLAFPLDFVDPGLAGASSFVNRGENITFPKVTIYGPLTNFSVRNYTTGKQLRTTGVSIGASETVEVDMWEETIYKNGDPSQPLMQYLDTVQSEFWEMQPGDNLIGIFGSAPDPLKTRARVDWWDSYV